MKKNVSFYILAICLFLGGGIGVYFAKTHQLKTKADAYHEQAALQNQMANQLKELRKNLINLNKPDYNQSYLNSLVAHNLIYLQDILPENDSSTLAKLKNCLITDYLSYKKLTVENNRLKKALESYENQVFSPCNKTEINFSNIMQYMHDGQKITKEDLKVYNIAYTYSEKNKSDKYYLTNYFNGDTRMVIIQNWGEHRILAYLILREEDKPLHIFSSTIKGDYYDCGVQTKIYDNGLLEIRRRACKDVKETLEYHTIKL